MLYPKVSIILPTYNRAATIGRAIGSVQAQTYTDWELIVVDDASEEPFRQLDYGFPMTTFRYNHRLGAARARNCAISQAKGEYLAFIDSDDQWHPKYLEKQVAALDGNQEVELSYSLSRLGGRKSRMAKTHKYQIEMLLDNFIPSLSQVVLARRQFGASRVFNPELKVCHDRALYLRVFDTTVPACVPEVLVTRYHQGDNLTTMDGGKLWLEDGLKMFRLFFQNPDNRGLLQYRAQAEQNLCDRVADANRV